MKGERIKLEGDARSLFALRLQAWIDHKFGSTDEFATAAGVTKSSVSHWLSGRNMPTRHTLLRVCEVLGVQPVVLVPTWEEGADAPIEFVQLERHAKTDEVVLTLRVNLGSRDRAAESIHAIQKALPKGAWARVRGPKTEMS